MERKKIAFVNTDMHIGGIPKASIPLLEQLQKHYDVTLFLTNGEGELIDKVPTGIRVEVLPSMNYKKRIFSALKRGRIFTVLKSLWKNAAAKNWICNAEAQVILYPKQAEHFDCAMAFFGMNSKCILATLHQIQADKKIAWIHGDHPFRKEEFAAVERLYQRFDKILCGSISNAQQFVSDFPSVKDKTGFFYCLINTREIECKAKESAAFTNGKLNIVSVGRLSPEKGQDMIPMIARSLKDKGLDFLWTLVGDGPLMESLRQEVVRLNVTDVISFVGAKANPYPYFAGCDIFVQPSYTEGYSIVTREAAIFGKPIVATNVGGQPEGFQNDYDILLVNPNVAEITAALEHLLLNPIKRDELAKNVAGKDYSNIDQMQKILDFVG